MTTPNTKKETIVTAQPQHRKFEGVVVSDAANKTVGVLVKTTKIHPKYKKQYVTSKKYQAHDENNQAKIGDTVIIVEGRPMSKTKRWYVKSIVKTAISA